MIGSAFGDHKYCTRIYVLAIGNGKVVTKMVTMQKCKGVKIFHINAPCLARVHGSSHPSTTRTLPRVLTPLCEVGGFQWMIEQRDSDQA